MAPGARLPGLSSWEAQPPSPVRNQSTRWPRNHPLLPRRPGHGPRQAKKGKALSARSRQDRAVVKTPGKRCCHIQTLSGTGKSARVGRQSLDGGDVLRARPKQSPPAPSRGTGPPGPAAPEEDTSRRVPPGTELQPRALG